MRDETDLGALTAEMLHVVDETMRPEFVGLWLREPVMAQGQNQQGDDQRQSSI